MKNEAKTVSDLRDLFQEVGHASLPPWNDFGFQHIED